MRERSVVGDESATRFAIPERDLRLISTINVCKTCYRDRDDALEVC